VSFREPLRRVYRGETNIDFIGRSKLWFVISAFLVIGSLTLLFTKGLNLGIEFEGGLQISAPIPAEGPLGDESDDGVIAEIREVAAGAGSSSATIQVASADGQRTLIVQTDATGESANELEAAVSEAIGGEIQNSDQIGAKWGQEITSKALRALIVFIVLVVAFISWRFEWKMALSAMVALIHDLLITAGVYSLVGFEVTPATVIALLTILGYSLYDTIVVFDKVEEDTTLYAATGRMTYRDAANRATNEVFMRSLNTSLSTVLPVAALLIVGTRLAGSGTLEDLALALLVGIMLGAYSSIFLATPILALLKEREPRFRNVREKVLRDAKREAAKPAPPVQEPVAEAATPAAATAGTPSTKGPGPKSSVSRPPPRARAGSKKAKRRKRR
jgi:preprotein translocase subunit SecF